MKKGGCVYIMTNKYNTVVYTGVTSDLYKRVHQHKNKTFKDSFTSKYELTKLVYYEGFHNIEEAIVREKQIKSGPRKKKNELIKKMNPEWKDLFEDVKHW
jgi:putative endonuclease